MASKTPEHLRGTAQPGAQLVQLEVREMEMEEEALEQGVRVPTCTSEPPRNSGLSKAEDPLGGGRIEPFGQSREHHGDLVRGGFQAIQGGVASGTACAPWHAWQRKVWIGSARPCLPSPTSAWM